MALKLCVFVFFLADQSKCDVAASPAKHAVCHCEARSLPLRRQAGLHSGKRLACIQDLPGSNI